LYKLISGESFAEVWEKALKICVQEGVGIATDYDKSGDPLSKDITAMLVVENPDKEPKLHKAGFPMGIKDLFDYIDEVTKGTKDHLSDKLGYTYHERMVDYRGIDQISYVVKDLIRSKCSRRSQVIIWDPQFDINKKSPPCLQRLWFRIINEKLCMNVHMRSNDLFKATLSNMIAFYEIQKIVAQELNIDTGSYCHIADSLHIYGSYLDEVDRTIKSFKNRSWDDRTWTIDQAKKFI